MVRITLYAFMLLAMASTSASAQAIEQSHSVIFGDIAVSIIQWVLAAFGPLIAASVLWLVLRMLKAVGIKNTDLLKDQLQAIIVNGINFGAARVQSNIAGKGKVEIKNQAAAHAVEYVQNHGAGIIKALGLDPQSGEAIQAIRARIETAIADPTTPTNPVVTPATVTDTPKVAVVGSVK